MEVHTERVRDPFFEEEAGRDRRAADAAWHALGTLYRWRRFIAAVTGVVAVAVVVITLLMPNWYNASASVLLPESAGASGLTAMLGDLGPAAAALLGGGGGDYVRYMAILNSRGVLDTTVARFDLVRVYELEDSPNPRHEAIESLRGYLEVALDQEYEFLTVSVLDRDPERAAAMANFLVEELNRRNARLASQSASTYRESVELRLRQANRDLDSAKAALQRFQEEHGVIDLPTTAQTALSSAAELRASVLQLQINAEALARQYGAQNPQAAAALEMARAADRKFQAMLQGSEALLPVALRDLPLVGRQYADIVQQLETQKRIHEFIVPLYEQAVFNERRETPAVQVLDRAVPPVRKAAPRRTIIVVTATLSAFLLAVLFVLIYGWMHRHSGAFLQRLKAETARPQ